MITVVVPLYNKEKSIVSTIESVVAQAYKDWELIIVDDGSTDGSADVVRDFIRANDEMSRANALNEPLLLNDGKIRLIHQENGGVCSARNRGIREAKGEYIAFLDGDDLWDKEYLSEQVKMIDDFPEAAMWSINYAEIYQGQIVRRIPIGLTDGFRGYVENYFKKEGRISDLCSSSSVVLRRSVFDEVGYFDERIKFSEDSDMWWRVIATHRFAFYDRYMVYYRLDAENRALKRRHVLRSFLPYYVGKYQVPMFRQNSMFYTWINCWAACHLKEYYFEGDANDRKEAQEAIKTLDYAVIPFKYRLFFHLPYDIAKRLYEWDLKRRGEA